MREIKFRALRLARFSNKKEEMVYGQVDIKPNKDARIVTYEKNKKGELVRRGMLVDWRTVGQFTGLTDSTGNLLYEDDVCWNPHDETWGQVVWDEGGWCYRWENIIENLHDIRDLIELRGNIHENPDLIAGQS